MKGIKKTICLVLVMLMVLMGTTAFAGTKYSNSVGLGNVLTRATEAPEATEEPLPSEAPAEETEPEATEEPVVEEPAPEATEEPAVEEPAPEATEEPAADEMPIVEDELIEEVEGPVAVGEADVRVAANGLSDIFATLPDGTALTVLGVEGDWVIVDIDGQTGYIYKDSVAGVEFEQTDASDDAESVENLKVTIFTSRRTVVAPGEAIYLTSKLEGFEDYTVTYQWQYDRGNGFEDIEGATGDTYTYAASVETLSYDWRLVISYE